MSVFVLVIVLTFGICIVVNMTLLEKYYTTVKENVMIQGFNSIKNACKNDIMETDEYAVQFEQLCNNANLSTIVMGSGGEVVIASGEHERLKMQFMDALLGMNNSRAQIVITTDEYTIQRQTDDRLESEYLILWGTLDNMYLVMMRTPLESIRTSSQLSTRFLILTGAIAVIIAIVVSLLFSRKLAKPIVQLTDISKRMTALDFEAEYKGSSNNEIDVLGENMNELSKNLERTISELKMANNELKKDIEKKEQIDEMRKDFISNVSHELKTPLALISGYAEGLKECINEDQESRDFYCEVIMDEADKMNQMVKKLISLNKLESGNDTVSMDRFDMTELITGVINSHKLLADNQGIEIEFDNDRHEYVWGDEFMIEEVVTNYLTNAINHCDLEKKIKIYYTNVQDAIRISVFNTGNNIPEDELDKVWIKFYKVDKARTREYGGSGIGLSIVKAIMESHHRDCGVNNHEGGVEFWFEMENTI